MTIRASLIATRAFTLRRTVSFDIRRYVVVACFRCVCDQPTGFPFSAYSAITVTSNVQFPTLCQVETVSVSASSAFH